MRCLESSFDVLGCAELLQWLHQAKKTGALRVSYDAAVRRIYFLDGDIVACSSNEPRLLLGQYLIAHGRIDDVVLQDCMKRQQGSGRSLGSLLVEHGAIAEADVAVILAARAQEVILGVFDWPEAHFRFEADQLPPKDAMAFRIDAQAALAEGAKRLEELDRIRSAFHSPYLIPQKSKRAVDRPTLASHMERKLYEAVDGNRTLSEIALVCRTSEYAAGRFLLRQVDSGLFQVRNIRAPRTNVIDDGTALTRLRELLASEEYEAAVDWIERHALKPDGDEFLEMLIAKAEAGFLATMYRTELPADSVPRRARADEPPGSEAEVLSAGEMFLLDLVDGRWDVRSLGWIAPMRKIDIVRGLARLRKVGCIELDPPPRAPASSGNSRRRTDDLAIGGDTASDIERAVGELGA